MDNYETLRRDEPKNLDSPEPTLINLDYLHRTGHVRKIDSETTFTTDATSTTYEGPDFFTYECADVPFGD